MTHEETTLFEEISEAKNRKRTTDFGISFIGGYASGWAFGVPPAFRGALDIQNLRYVDKEKSKDLRSKGDRKNSQTKLPTAFKYLWTRGDPPSLSFAQGDIFYRPSGIRNLPWQEALEQIISSVQVLAAQPDNDKGTGGWVEFQLSRYERGIIITQSNLRLSQTDFETVLCSGDLPKSKT